MRIRKNAKLFGGVEMELSEGSKTPSEVHHCQLNRSPWDLPGDGDDCFAVNGSFGDSIGAALSFPSAESMDVSFDYGLKRERPMEEETKYQGSANGGGRTESGSHCQLEAKSEHSTALYDHHINAYPHSLVVPTPARRRGRPRKTAVTTVGPNDFYYYSGFGPRQWGHRSGEGKVYGTGDAATKNDSSSVDTLSAPAASGYADKIMAGPEVGLDYIDDEDEEEEMKKVGRRHGRGRKPIKARSLKSLM